MIYAADQLVQGVGQNGKPFAYRKVSLTDKTKLSFELKLWGQMATNFDFEHPVTVILRRAKVEVYNGQKGLSLSSYCGLFWPEPDIEDAEEMLTWFKKAIN